MSRDRLAWIASFKVGERRYVETSLRRYAQDMRALVPYRRNQAAAMVFRLNSFTAASASKLGDVRFLICVERVK